MNTTMMVSDFCAALSARVGKVRGKGEENVCRKGTVKVALGDTCIEIQCQDQELGEKMLTSYRPFLVSREPDFRIKLSLKHSLTAPEVKQILMNSNSYLDEDRYFTKPELLQCRIDWAKATIWVDTEGELFAPSVDYKLMNSLMRGIYSGIHVKLRNIAPNAYLVHGCGILDGEQCYLFTGPSGSGKTTVARLAEGRKVLNDEALLVGRDTEGFYLSGTPLEGGTADICNISGRLSSIFFLKHAERVSLRRLSKVETYTRLLPQILDTSPLFEAAGNDCLEVRADLSAGMSTTVPSYELCFRPDTSFWPVIGDI